MISTGRAGRVGCTRPVVPVRSLASLTRGHSFLRTLAVLLSPGTCAFLVTSPMQAVRVRGPFCDHVLLHPLPGTPETPLDDQSKAVCPQLLNTPPRCVYTVCNQIALVIHIITSKLAWLHSCAQARCAPNQEPVVGTACVSMACSSAHGHAIHLYTLLDHAPWDIQRLPARWTRPESGRTTTPSHRLVSAHTERVTANASYACGGSSPEQVSPLPSPFLANIR